MLKRFPSGRQKILERKIQGAKTGDEPFLTMSTAIRLPAIEALRAMPYTLPMALCVHTFATVIVQGLVLKDPLSPAFDELECITLPRSIRGFSAYEAHAAYIAIMTCSR